MLYRACLTITKVALTVIFGAFIGWFVFQISTLFVY